MANPHIISFIQNLTPAETKLVEDYLHKSLPLIETGEEGKELKLFKYIIANKNRTITDEEISNETHTPHFSHLKQNLYEKVLESLTLDKYITNVGLFDKIDIVQFTLKKKLLVCKISLKALNQGKIEAINELLNEIIIDAKEFELYDTLVEALRAKKYFRGSRAGLQEFETINKELRSFEYCYDALMNANDNYFRLILNNEFIKTFSDTEAEKHITASIKQMELDYKKTKSEQINYYLHIMRFALFERHKNYTSAIDQCNKLIAILKKHKSIYRNERMGFALTNLAQYKTFIGEYDEALKDAKRSQKYYLEDSFNYAVSKEQEFYANFYNENYDEATKCLNVLLNHSSIDTGEFRKSKYIYYLACVYYAEKNYKEALHLLNESLEIEKDKTRWNISLRVLNIMIFIELHKIDEAFASLGSLRKYIERTGKTAEVSKRDVLIVKLLRELEKFSFEYDPQNTTVEKIIETLSEKDSDTSWEYFSSELIPFHKWIESKKKK